MLLVCCVRLMQHHKAADYEESSHNKHFERRFLSGCHDI
jgi:hypothetical protein